VVQLAATNPRRCHLAARCCCAGDGPELAVPEHGRAAHRDEDVAALEVERCAESARVDGMDDQTGRDLSCLDAVVAALHGVAGESHTGLEVEDQVGEALVRTAADGLERRGPVVAVAEAGVLIEIRVPVPSASNVMHVSIGPGSCGTEPPLWR
jgi:hypothetical protein